MCSIENWYLWYIFYTKFIYILCKFYLVRSLDYSWNNNLIMLCPYVKEICVLYLKTLFFFIEPLSSDQYSKYCQSCFNAVFSTLKQHRWKKLNFHFQPNIKVETTLIYRRWINVILSNIAKVVSMLFSQRWSNADEESSTFIFNQI